MAIQKIPNTLIADNAVTASKIANGTLTADDISNNSITAAKLSVSTSPTFGGLTTTGDINITGTVTSDGLTVEPTSATGLTYGADGTNSFINFEANSVAASVQLYAGQSSGGFFSIGTKDSGGTLAERMRVTSTGVGIGVSSPSVALEVGDGTATANWLRLNGTTSDLYIGQNTGFSHFGQTNAIKILSVSNHPLAYGTANDYPLIFGVNDSEQMRLTSTGLGIGTTSINHKLDVAGNMSTTGELYLETQNKKIAFNAGNSSSNKIGAWDYNSGSPVNPRAYIEFLGVDANQDTDIVFHTSTDSTSVTEVMRITENQKVGINETSPDYKLHITGSGSAAQMQIESTSNTNAQLIFRNTASAGSGITGGFHIGLLGDTSGDGLIYHHHDKPIRFYTNAANTMTLTGENGMLHLNGRSGAYGYAVPQDEALGYTNNLNAGAFGILHRGSYDSYVTGNTYYYKTGGSSGWRAKYGAYKSTVMGMVNGAFTFDCSSAAPGSNGASVSGLAARVRIDSDGLKFGSDTAAANALDDYEEGTFTLSPNTGTISTQVCKYTKVGRIVTFVVDFTVGTGGATTYSGLPFGPNSTLAWVPYVVGQTFATNRTYPTMVVGATGTNIIMRDCGSGQSLSSMAVTAGATYHTCFSYTTDS